MSAELGPRVVSLLASAFLRTLRFTIQIRHVSSERIDQMNREGRRYILAFWHGHLLFMVFSKWAPPMAAMISQSKDGEYIAQTIARFGAGTVRGSSSRGATSALRQIVRTGREGNNLGFTPDGPRGPRHVAQPGVIAAAQLTGFPIIPMVIVPRRKTLLKSWDRFEVPSPFTRVLMVYGESIAVPARLTESEQESVRADLEQRMNRLCEDVERDFEMIWAGSPLRG